MRKVAEVAEEFLASKRIAVTGVSRSPADHGANVVYRRLRERGYEVSAVNPNADRVEGDPCLRDLKSIPDGVDAVVIGTRPDTAEATHAGARGARRQVRVDAPNVRAGQGVGHRR